MIGKPLNPELVFDLINAFKSIKSEKDSALFLQDILTASEIKKLSIRLRVAKLLLKDKKQREISRMLKVSIATVTKVNSWLNQKGEGFKNVISKLPIKYEKPKTFIKGPIEYHLPEIVVKLALYGAASLQERSTKKLIESVQEKSDSDKFLKEISDEEYKHRRKS